MKKRMGSFLTVLLCILLFMAGTTGCTVLKTEQAFQETVEITAQNVPDGTYYADLLVQLPEKDRLRVQDTSVRPDGADITENSEIFRYSKENYVSASLHYGYAQRFVRAEEPERNTLTAELELGGSRRDGRFSRGKYFLRIPSFRIAYVSQDGRVLGVTEPAAAHSLMTPMDAVTFYADGSAARYVYISGSKVNPAEILLILELLVLAVIVLPLYAVIARMIGKREWNSVVKQIQQNAAQDDADAPRT